MATAKELLAVAVRQLNVREDPPGSNNVRYNTWYYGREVSGKAYPWCMAFVQWCFDQAGVKLPARTASCGTLMNAAKSFGIWVTEDFQPGDVAIYDFSGKQKTTEHCGIVEQVTNYSWDTWCCIPSPGRIETWNGIGATREEAIRKALFGKKF